MLSEIYSPRPRLVRFTVHPVAVAEAAPEYPGKRLFDLLLAGLVTLLVLSWLVPIVGLLILTTSRGPVFFIQRRTGLNGRPFRCYKFRTMRQSADRGVFRQTARHDDRVTPLGRVLRRTNIDEIPQLLNVLRGEMSIVGPRPHPLPLDDQFWDTLDGYPQRYRARPGLTGLAQSRGCRGAVVEARTMKHRVMYDRLYIRKASLGFDLRICWLTMKAMLGPNPDAF
jgi:putative colanic acid biosysnthesis UDP-glucose lipid carrier transferase